MWFKSYSMQNFHSMPLSKKICQGLVSLIRTNIEIVSFEFRFRIPSFSSAGGFPPSLLISWATAFYTPGNLYLAGKYSIWRFFRLIYERYASDGPFVSEVDFQIKLLRYSLLKYIYIFCGGTEYPHLCTVVQWYSAPTSVRLTLDLALAGH